MADSAAVPAERTAQHTSAPAGEAGPSSGGATPDNVPTVILVIGAPSMGLRRTDVKFYMHTHPHAGCPGPAAGRPVMVPTARRRQMGSACTSATGSSADGL